MDFVWEKIDVVNGEPSERILIIARNYRYIQEWCRIHGINHQSRMVRPVMGINDLYGHGVTGCYYVELGTDNEALRELTERLKSLDAIRPLLTPNI